MFLWYTLLLHEKCWHFIFLHVWLCYICQSGNFTSVNYYRSCKYFTFKKRVVWNVIFCVTLAVLSVLKHHTDFPSHSLAYVSQHSVFLGEARLADKRDNIMQTHKHCYTRERKGHRGNSQLCTVNEKPACQDVPHSWMNKRGSESLSS